MRDSEGRALELDGSDDKDSIYDYDADRGYTGGRQR